MDTQQQTERLVLDQQAVDAIELPDGKTEHIEWDRDLKGFGFRLRKESGRLTRTYVVRYRLRGRQRKPKIGDYATITAKEARKAAKKVLAKVQLGHDPQAEREAERQSDARTLIATAKQYLEMKEQQVERGQYRASSLRVTRLYLTGTAYFGPLHQMPVASIGLADIASRLNAINSASGHVTAGRARSALSSMYVWACQQGLMGSNSHNPVALTKNPDDAPSRDLTLSDVQLAEVWRAAGDDDFGRVIKLLILTGCRREEIGGLRWSEIDRNAGTITLPSVRVKNRHEHVLPITSLTAEIFDSIPPVVGRDQVFGARSTNGFNGWDAALKALKQRLAGKLKGKSVSWRPHDLRRSLATWLCEHDVEPWTIESILNHWSGHRRGIASVYNKAKHHRQARTALTLWDDHLRSIIEDRKPRVIPLKST